VSQDPPCLDGITKIDIDPVPSPNPLSVKHEEISEPSASPKRSRMSVEDGQENGISPPPEETIYERMKVFQLRYLLWSRGQPEVLLLAGKSAMNQMMKIVEAAEVLTNAGKSVPKPLRDAKKLYVVPKSAGKSAVNQVTAMVKIPVVTPSATNPVLQHNLQGMPVVQVPEKDAVLPGSSNSLVNAKIQVHLELAQNGVELGIDFYIL